MDDKKARKHKFRNSWQKNYDTVEITLDKMRQSKVLIKTHAIERWNERVEKTDKVITAEDIHRYVCAHIRHAIAGTHYERDINKYMRLWGPKNSIVTFDNDIVAICKLRRTDDKYVLFIITVLGRISDNPDIGTEYGVKMFLRNRIDVKYMEQSEIEGRLDMKYVGGI